MWTAASDADYDVECGNGESWDQMCPEDHKEFELWLEETGAFDLPDDEAWDRYLNERERVIPALVTDPDDDIAF